MGFVNCEVKDKIAVITINRPEALNALNSQVLDDLEAAFDGLDLEVVRAVVLTGAGEKSFVAGADIGEMSTLSKAEGEAFGKKGNDIFRKIEQFPVRAVHCAESDRAVQHHFHIAGARGLPGRE